MDPEDLVHDLLATVAMLTIHPDADVLAGVVIVAAVSPEGQVRYQMWQSGDLVRVVGLVSLAKDQLRAEMRKVFE